MYIWSICFEADLTSQSTCYLENSNVFPHNSDLQSLIIIRIENLQFIHAATLQSDDCPQQFLRRGKTGRAVFTLDS